VVSARRSEDGPRPPRQASADPRRALGARGEALAARHLEALGFEIVVRNFRTSHGELDLVARDARHLVFCEVKTRVVRGDPGPHGPFAAIGPRKRRRVRAMAREWFASGAGTSPGPPEIRFDAIGVSYDDAGRLVALEHLEGAF
jgi:putative endonuclease